MSRRKWIVLGGVLGVLIALAVPVSAWIANRASGPSEKSVLEQGFAIWPVDTLSEARSECPSPLIPSWRHSARETVRRFAREMLGVTTPDVRGPGSSRGKTFYEIYGRQVPLFHYADVRRSGSCWYVTNTLNREGFCCRGRVGVAGIGAGRTLFLHIRADKGLTRLLGEVGYGDLTVRATEMDLLEESDLTLQLTIPVGHESDSSGHHTLAFTSEPDFPAYHVEGSVIGALADPADAVAVPMPRDARPEILAGVRDKKGCEDVGWYEGYGPLSTVRFFKQDAEEQAAGGQDYRVDVLRGSRRGDPVVAIDQARVRFDFWRVRGECRMLGRIVPLRGAERVRGIGVFDSAASFDLNWGRATDVWMEVSFRGTGTRGAASRIANPIVIDDGEQLNTRRSGGYVVFFYEGEHLINIDSGALPPIGSLAD